MNKSFTKEACEEYLYWQTQDKKTLKKINRLINDIARNPFEGIGKPEPLKHIYQGAWSRRIDEKNRMVYMFDERTIYLISLKDHYE
ncbi:toxin YoeB [Pilibacter termitis]|jgi:toxin YoeB|uniref:Endoribonuclease YoeB n=1 Tax=Pilibacter termitis TaxID=263852 RepID=A0A1T4LRC2_9ENTE|nr:Txe/YoeB family addiction module toxin [Pilibacter termitis]SJZ57223.1 toxin YoeB [Pilibacter termitis]